jgi:hypothetical protein
MASVVLLKYRLLQRLSIIIDIFAEKEISSIEKKEITTKRLYFSDHLVS